MNEIAHATVCFSRAWREGMYGVSAFWVHPDQVKKSAPSGEFLPKGSFHNRRADEILSNQKH